MRDDGYELFRQLNRGGEISLHHGERDYRMSWFGEKTDAGSGLRVTCEETGEVRRFRGGYSSEAIWNFITTLESGRWDSPVGEWTDPGKWTD
jgi:hypothetical protein